MNTSKFLIISIVLVTVIILAGCCTQGFKRINTPEGELAVPNCCPMIKYSGTSISVKGVDLPISEVPIKIGEVTVEPKTLQQASEIVQILELHRISTCQLLPSCATVSKAKFVESLDEMQKDEAILTQFALVVASKDGNAIQEFVKRYGSQGRYLVLKVNLEKMVGKASKGSGGWLKEFEPSKSVAVLPFHELFHP